MGLGGAPPITLEADTQSPATLPFSPATSLHACKHSNDAGHWHWIMRATISILSARYSLAQPPSQLVRVT